MIRVNNYPNFMPRIYCFKTVYNHLLKFIMYKAVAVRYGMFWRNTWCLVLNVYSFVLNLIRPQQNSWFSLPQSHSFSGLPQQ